MTTNFFNHTHTQTQTQNTKHINNFNAIAGNVSLRVAIRIDARMVACRQRARRRSPAATATTPGIQAIIIVVVVVVGGGEAEEWRCCERG